VGRGLLSVFDSGRAAKEWLCLPLIHKPLTDLAQFCRRTIS